MDPASASFALLGLVVIAALIGVALRRGANRRRRTEAVPETAELLGLTSLGSTATLVQFSTDWCAQCPGTRRALTALAAAREGVEFYEIDVAAHPDLANRFSIRQTPTVLILDSADNLVARYHGPTATHIIEADIAELEGSQP